MPVDLYRTIHKAQRFHLFAFGERLSRADLSETGQREGIVRDVRELVRVLGDHADNEHRYIHPLFAALGEVGDRMDEEHTELELALSSLLEATAVGPVQSVYGSFTRFLVTYLKHIDDEERAQDDVLWPHYSDAEMAAVLMRFHAERRPEDARHDLAFMLPALNLPELVTIFTGMRASASQEAFDGAVRLAHDTLGADGWAAVAARLPVD